MYFLLAMLGLCWYTRAFSSPGVQASQCGDVSCCGARALEHVDFSNCALQALEQHVLSSQGLNSCPFCIGSRILNHWTTREGTSVEFQKLTWEILHFWQYNIYPEKHFCYRISMNAK